MKAHYDFARAKRGAVASNEGKMRITLLLDPEIIEAAQVRAQRHGTGSQTLINDLLRLALITQATQ
ncbi:BrnA antitoxin family protein [Pseudomonas asplenii]|uniref:BrnA antitoxin of type II toxin-antitoxin system n=1 Tax=Pseudomonas asplenii TaxID=53407 RepID=A0A1H6NXG6_9PSED|nr:BrnA antitoxin family protein [Pseudomonas fuscovaginae]SEI16565.1 BrnA antitoxin of type II toxin-antitoxin system [Pseudomonas fuscovaginae]